MSDLLEPKIRSFGFSEGRIRRSNIDGSKVADGLGLLDSSVSLLGQLQHLLTFLPFQVLKLKVKKYRSKHIM